MEQKQINDHGVIPEATRFVSGADDDQGPQTCMAIISKDGEQRRCKAKPIMGDRFCYHHSDRLSPTMRKVEQLMIKHKEDFFTNMDVRLKVQRILNGFRPRRLSDKKFLKELETSRKEARKQRDQSGRWNNDMHKSEEKFQALKDDAIDALVAAAEQLRLDKRTVQTFTELPKADYQIGLRVRATFDHRKERMEMEVRVWKIKSK